MATRERSMRMAVMRTTVNPVINKRIPAPMNQASTNPDAIRIAEPKCSVRNNIIDYTRVVFGNINVFFANRLD